MASVTQPKDIDEYKNWLATKLKVDISQKTKNHYESVTNKIVQEFGQSDFWKNLISSLEKML
jgi:hypothetical protein